MGLDHSENMDAVMAPTLQPWYQGLHQDDIEGIHFAYGEMEHRQVTRYVSPLAYSKTETQQNGLSCGTVTNQSSATGAGICNILSVVAGLLISFVRKIGLWFKSLL
jgi:hypothetical protein